MTMLPPLTEKTDKGAAAAGCGAAATAASSPTRYHKQKNKFIRVRPLPASTSTIPPWAGMPRLSRTTLEKRGQKNRL